MLAVCVLLYRLTLAAGMYVEITPTVCHLDNVLAGRHVPPRHALRWSGPARALSKQCQTLKLAHLFSEYDERAAVHF